MSSLIIGIMAGIVGSAYFMYGKRASKPVAMVAGGMLCIYPYFSDSLVWLCVVGPLLAVAPFVIEI
jgi:hypothetical protein